MGNEVKESVVAIGWKEGERFIAVKPSLNDQEIKTLQAQNLINAVNVEQIVLEPACSQVAYETLASSSESVTRRVQGLALANAAQPRLSRGGIVETALDSILLNGLQSSPFNPDTDLRRAETA